MVDSCYLVFDRHGIRKMTKTRPALSAGQFAVKVRVNCPPTVFDNAIPEAVLEVTERAMVTPTVTLDMNAEPELTEDEREDTWTSPSRT